MATNNAINAPLPLGASQGGTGTASPAAHTIPIAEGSSAFTFVGPLTNGQVLIGSTGADPVAALITVSGNLSTTTGAGTFNISTTGAAGFTWNNVSGTTQTIVANNGYIANNAATVAFTMPATAAQGTIISIAGQGAGGWSLTVVATQTIHFGNVDTTISTGTLASTNRHDCVEMLCTVANTEFVVLDSIGNITYT